LPWRILPILVHNELNWLLLCSSSGRVYCSIGIFVVKSSFDELYCSMVVLASSLVEGL